MRPRRSTVTGAARRLTGPIVVSMAVLAHGAAAQATPGQGGVAVDPAQVVSGMLYSGATVRVSAVVPRGVRVAMVCRGEDRPLVLKKKGKVLGLIWMNVGKVTFKDVPNVYLLRTSAPMDSLAPPPVLEQQGVGFGALAARSGLEASQRKLFDELLQLKEKDRVWGTAPATVSVEPAQGGVALATTDFVLPAKAGPGTYRILVYTFADGRGRLAGSTRLSVKEGGSAAFVTGLAKRHALLYGILAAVVAMAVGLLTGLVFGLSSKH